MDQGSLDFWKDHSITFLNMAFKSDKREVLEHPDGYAKRSRECGDTVEIFLLARDGAILSASFETNGCIYSVACANAVSHLAEGKSLEEAADITEQDVMDLLETLPASERHCAELATTTLRLAISNVQDTLRHPWKKLYGGY